jgi:hypothetical protein
VGQPTYPDTVKNGEDMFLNIAHITNTNNLKMCVFRGEFVRYQVIGWVSKVYRIRTRFAF